jgi:hypothetical protein
MGRRIYCGPFYRASRAVFGLSKSDCCDHQRDDEICVATGVQCKQTPPLSLIWQSISYLIPFAMYPFLWLLPYGAILYLVFRRKLYSRSLPILIFSTLYVYFIAKDYLRRANFARVTMLLFPGFCILVGLAYGDLLRLLKKQRMSSLPGRIPDRHPAQE